MKKRIKKSPKKDSMIYENCNTSYQNCGGCFYFLGFLGSAIYYIQNSVGFWNGVLGVLKALVWPLFLVYKLLGL